MFDKNSALIVLGIVALITLPFIIYSVYKKSKTKKFLTDFLHLAEQEKLNISKNEVWNHNYAIGIDNDSGKLFYVRKEDGNLRKTLIDLSLVEKCRIDYLNRTSKSQDGISKISDRIELIFSFRNKNTPEKAVEFYDSTEFMPTSDDMHQVENWRNIVNSALEKVN
jgi:hypothetical protein